MTVNSILYILPNNYFKDLKYLVSNRRASSLSKLADTEAAIVIGVLIVAVSPLAGM